MPLPPIPEGMPTKKVEITFELPYRDLGMVTIALEAAVVLMTGKAERLVDGLQVSVVMAKAQGKGDTPEMRKDATTARVLTEMACCLQDVNKLFVAALELATEDTDDA